MFKVFTTAAVIDRIVNSLTSRRKPECGWMGILSTQNVFYYSGAEDHMDSVIKKRDMNDPWFIAQMAGKKFIWCNEYLEDVKRNPERVLENPDSAFLLDVDDSFAKQVEQEYGVICQPVSKLDTMCKVSEHHYPVELYKYEEGSDPDDTRKSWKDVIGDDACKYPSNAMVIVDRNFWSDTNRSTDEMCGIENLVDLLDTVLPKKLKCEYQVLVVYQHGCRDKSDPRETEENFLEEMEAHLNRLARPLRKYPVSVKMLAVRKPPQKHYEQRHRDLFNETHNRRIVTNYFVLKGEWSMAPFWKDKGPRGNQTISWDKCFAGVGERPRQDLPVYQMEEIIGCVKEILDGQQDIYSIIQPLENRLIQQ